MRLRSWTTCGRKNQKKSGGKKTLETLRQICYIDNRKGKAVIIAGNGGYFHVFIRNLN